MAYIRDGIGQDFLDPTRPVNFKIIAGWPAGRPVSDRPGRPVFLQKVFVHCSMYLMKNFQKGGRGMGDRAGQVRKLVRKSANPQLRTNEKSCGHADLRTFAV